MTVPAIAIDKQIAVKAVNANQVGNLTVHAPDPAEFAALLDRVASQEADTDDLKAVEAALISGGGDGRLAFGGVSVVVGHADTVTQETLVYEGPSAAAVAEVLTQIQVRVSADAAKSAQQSFASAVRRHGGALPYPLPGLRDADRLGPVFIPLRASRHDVVGDVTMVGDSGDALKQLAEMLREPEAIPVVIGPAGSGKSTLLRRVTGLAFDEPAALGLDGPHLAMPMKLRHLAAAESVGVGARLWRALELGRELQMAGAPPAGDYFESWPSALGAPWLLMLDGFDEVPEDRRAELCSWIAGIREVAPDVRLILSARSADDLKESSLAGSLVYLGLSSLGSEEIRAIADKWLEEDRAAELEDSAEQMTMRHLFELPLTATFAAILYRQNGRLPESRVELFEGVAEIALSQAERQGLGSLLDRVHPMLRPNLVRPLLEHLALASLKADGHSLSDDGVATATASFLINAAGLPGAAAAASAGPLIDVLGRTSGVLRPGEGLNWLHAELRDYLTACALAAEARAKPESLAEAAARWTTYEWRAPILSLFALMGRRKDTQALEAMMRAILRAPVTPGDNGRVEAITIMAGEALAEAGSISPATDKAILARICNSPDQQVLYYSACDRLLRPKCVLDVLERFRSRPALMARIGPLIEYVETLARTAADRHQRVLAVNTLCWMNLFDNIDRLVEARDVEPEVILDAIVEFDGSLPRSWLESVARRIEQRLRDEPAPSAAAGTLSAEQIGNLVRLVSATDAKTAADPTVPPLLRLTGLLNDALRHPEALTASAATERARAVAALVGELCAPERSPGIVLDEEGGAYAMALASLSPAGVRRAIAQGPEAVSAHLRWLQEDRAAPRSLPELAERFKEVFVADEAWRVQQARCIAKAMAAPGLRGGDRFRRVVDAADDPHVSNALVVQLVKTGAHLEAYEQYEALSLERRIEGVEALLENATDEGLGLVRGTLLRLVERRLAEGSPRAEDLRRRAELLPESHDAGERLAAWTQLLEAGGHEAAALRGRAQVRLEVGEAELAYADFKFSLEHAPDASAWLGLSCCARCLGRPQDAFEAADAAVALGLDTPVVHAERGLALRELGFAAAALTEVAPFVAPDDGGIRPLATWVYAYLSDCALTAGDLDVADAALDAASAVDPDAFTLLRQAELHLLRGQPDGAAAAVDRAVALEPELRWVEVHAMLLKAVIGGERLSTSRLEDDDLAVQLWASIAADDEAAAHAAVAAAEEPADRRVLADELTRCARFAKRAWLDKLEAAHRAALRSDGVDVAPPLSQPPMKPAPLLRPAKLRLPIDILCRLSAVADFEAEKARAERMLAGWEERRAAIAFRLEDEDHVYIQGNFRDIPDADYNVKLIIPFRRGTDAGVLPRLLREWRLDDLLYDDAAVAELFRSRPEYATLARRLRNASEAPPAPKRWPWSPLPRPGKR